jgi:CheY-like chemotaxis protein
LILIADDSPIIQRKAQRILQDEGFEVQTVSNGVAAVKKLPTLQPVLVLADVSMPGKDGYEVCEFVKTSADLLHVPVLLVGSDLEPYDEQRGARVRADGIIKKPFTPHELIAAVSRFTGPAKAPASPPTLADTTVAASPEASEDVPGGSSEPSLAPTEPFPGFARGLTPESTAEDIPEVAPEPVWVSPEASREVEELRSREVEELRSREVEGSRPHEVQESRSQGADELILAPQFLDSSTPQLVDLTAPEAVPEPSLLTTEPTPEPVPEIAPEPVLVGPETIREVEELRSREVEESRSREVEGSEPREVEESGSRGADELISTPQLLDSSTPQLPDSSTPLDPEWVYKVVHKVVTKMAPPVLAPEHVEELARMLTREITAELGGVIEQPDLAPESPSSN